MVKIVFFLCLFFLSSDMAGADQDIEKREEPSRSEGFEKRREPSQTESEKAALFKSEKQMSQSGELKKSGTLTGPLYPKLPKAKEDPDDPLGGPPIPLLEKTPKKALKN